MAKSGYKAVSVTSYNTLEYHWTITSQSVVNNESIIYWELRLVAGNYGYIASSSSKSWAVTVNGNNYSGTNKIAINNNSTIVLASGSTTIAHNSDGSKDFSYSFSQQFDINFSGWVGTKTGSGSGTLEPIARGGAISTAPDFNDEENPKITYTNPLSNSTTDYTLMACISFNGSKADIPYRNINKTGELEYTFYLTDEERRILRAGTQGGNSRSLYFYVRTEIGDSTIYSSVLKTFTIKNPEPIINPIIIDIGETSKKLTGNAETMIKYFNDMKCTINASAVKEATIDKTYIKNGVNYVEASEYRYQYTDNNYFKFTAVDSRGNTVSKEITVPMVNYVPLTCNIEASIALSSGDSSKANITFTAKGNYFSGSFGAVSNELKIDYVVKDSSGGSNNYALTIPTSAISNNSYNITHTITDLDYQKSYTVELAASDKIYTNIKAMSKTLKAVPVFDWGENDFAFNVPISIQGKEVADFVTEQGELNGWSYRKWASGTGECWKIVTINTTITNSWGSLYVGDTLMTRQNYPFTFKSKPTETATLHCGTNAAWLFTESNGNGVNGAYSSAIYNVCRPSQVANTVTFYILIYAKGTLQ